MKMLGLLKYKLYAILQIIIIIATLVGLIGGYKNRIIFMGYFKTRVPILIVVLLVEVGIAVA